MSGPMEWAASGALLSTVVGIMALVVKAGPDWLSMRSKRDNLHADTAARVQGMTIEYAERLEAQLQSCLGEVEKLREALQEAHAENDRYRAIARSLPTEFQRRFYVVNGDDRA